MMIVEIILVLLIALALAKHKGKAKRRYRRYIKGQVDEELDLTTLASRTLVSMNFDETVDERTWISSVRATYALRNLTQAADVGPFRVGLAHSDYSSAEIEQWIENTGSWSEGDLVNREIGQRKIRDVGIFEAVASLNEATVLNDGKPITTKCGWILVQGQTLKIWVYNLGEAAVATTVPRVHAEGHANLWPSG